MICEKCKSNLTKLQVNIFNYEGIDYWNEVPITEIDNEDAVVITTDKNWTGYELSEEEMRDSIRCPYCHKWPVKNKEIQIYEPVEVLFFKE